MQSIRQHPSSARPPTGDPPRVPGRRRSRRRVVAILRQRCPACLAGSVYRSTFRMLPACQVCGHRFEHGPGYFRTATMVSAGIAVVALVGLITGMHRWLAPAHGETFAQLVASLLFLLLVPALYRYPRIIRAHLGIASSDRGPFAGRSSR